MVRWDVLNLSYEKPTSEKSSHRLQAASSPSLHSFQDHAIGTILSNISAKFVVFYSLILTINVVVEVLELLVQL